MLGFLLRLLFVVVLARLFMALIRFLGGSRRQQSRPAPTPPPAMPPHLGSDIVDAEFEEVRRERET